MSWIVLHSFERQPNVTTPGVRAFSSRSGAVLLLQINALDRLELGQALGQPGDVGVGGLVDPEPDVVGPAGAVDAGRNGFRGSPGDLAASVADLQHGGLGGAVGERDQ